jgi:uncharacterized protein (TIGR03118 family)
MKDTLNPCTGILFAAVLVLALLPAVSHATPTSTNQGYAEVDLVSDIATNAPNTDARLVNPWGLVVGPGVEWVNDNGTGLTTVYGAFGFPLSFAINIPAPDGTNAGTPDGLVFNDTWQFVITNAGVTATNGPRHAPATFLMATEDGTIAGWNYFVSRSNAVIAVDNSPFGAVYKGLAIARATNGAPQLYAANFHAGVVDVFDGHFHHVQSFTDTNVPAGFAPFNIKNIVGKLFVTFALQKPGAHDDQANPGNGYIDVFNPDGTLVRRFASQGALNSPWGMALAPWNFGPFSHALLVGNFGDGRINAYELATGNLLGHLTHQDGSDLVIDGLWGLGFAWELPCATVSDLDNSARLYFTAGVNGEADGLFGFIHSAGPTALTPLVIR